MPRVAPTITVSDDDRIVLLRWSRGRRTPARLVRRAKIVLHAADGWLNAAIAVELGTREKTVGLWRRRFAEQGTAGIERDASRTGATGDGATRCGRGRCGPKDDAGTPAPRHALEHADAWRPS